MYIDRQNLFGQDQAVTTSAASTDYIDLGAARRSSAIVVVLAIVLTLFVAIRLW